MTTMKDSPSTSHSSGNKNCEQSSDLLEKMKHGALHNFWSTPSNRHITFGSPESSKRPSRVPVLSSPLGGRRREIPSNPFDVEPEQLTLPSFSPSVFSSSLSTTSDVKPFKWSIDQIATFWPADINENSCQEFLDSKNEELEQKAQQAIDTFFSQNSIVPSPWTVSKKQRDLIFSPDLMSTAYCHKSQEDSPEVNNKRYDKCKNAQCQTILSIPPHVDIFKVLGQYMAGYQPPNGSSPNEESFGSYSLRRKLFSNTDKATSSPSNTETSSPTKTVATPGSAQLCSSPVTPFKCSFMGSSPAFAPVSPIEIGKESGNSSLDDENMSTSCYRTPSSRIARDGHEIFSISKIQSISNEDMDIPCSSSSGDTGYQTGLQGVSRLSPQSKMTLEPCPEDSIEIPLSSHISI